jgi:Uma2 family endonuclease
MARVSTDRVKTTYTDLLGWPEDGRRYELYDGEVSVVPAPFPRHQIAMIELHRRLYDYAAATGGIVLASPIDIVFTEETVLQPDIVVFTAARRHHVELDRVIRVPPDVAIEVISPGTAANDRGRKLKMFERFGVPEYWILDPHAERLDVLALRDAGYAPAASARRGESIASSVLPGFSCDAAALFPWTRSAD